jgi:acetoin utilization deacetylase AcuC-like enzyme
MPRPTTLVSHPLCGQHRTGRGHIESPRRLPALLAPVRADAELAPLLVDLLGTPATEADVLRVHVPEHVARVREAAELARRRRRLVWLDDDTPVSSESWEAALAAVGCVISAAEAVLDGKTQTAFALSRPPGHHATAQDAMGFCLFNNVAVAIRQLQAKKRIERALVVDWDAHHGNGTQEIFYGDPSVQFISLHLDPGYPGTGRAGEVGAGPGEGSNWNVPFPAGTSVAEYRRGMQEALEGALKHSAPDLVFISAGFDCLSGDPEGGFLLEPADIHQLTRDLVEGLPDSTAGRVVGALEGGYALDRIGLGLRDMLRALVGLPRAE